MPKLAKVPKLVRPTFSRRPPAAYRLAEPGDTLDRIGLYLSAGSAAIAAAAIAVRLRERSRGEESDLAGWPSASAW